MSCTLALLLLLASPAHSLGTAGSVAATGANGGGSKKSTWKTSASTAPPKCCEGQAMGLNTSLSIPTTCPVYNSSDNTTNDGKWRTTQDAACPAARPLCVRVKCSANFSFPNTTGPNASLIHMTLSTLIQGCNTSEGVDALLSQHNLTCEDITEYVEERNADLAPLASDGMSTVVIAGIVIGSVFGVSFCAFIYKEAGRQPRQGATAPQAGLLPR